MHLGLSVRIMHLRTAVRSKCSLRSLSCGAWIRTKVFASRERRDYHCTTPQYIIYMQSAPVAEPAGNFFRRKNPATGQPPKRRVAGKRAPRSRALSRREIGTFRIGEMTPRSFASNPERPTLSNVFLQLHNWLSFPSQR